MQAQSRLGELLRVLVLGLLGSLVGGLPGTASAEICNINMTGQACLDAVTNVSQAHLQAARAATTTVAQAQGARESTLLSQANTGGVALAGEGASTDDFNPKLQLITDGLLQGGDSGVLGLAVNDLFKAWLSDQLGEDGKAFTNQHYKLSVALGDAELFEPLAATVTDEALRRELTSQIDQTDEVIVDFRLSLQNDKWGRDFNHHLALLEGMQAEAMQATEKQVDKSAEGLEAAFEFIDAQGGNPVDDKTFAEMLRNDALAAQAVAHFEAFAGAEAAYKAAFESALNTAGFDRFKQLIDNQPQLVLTLGVRERDELVGQDEAFLGLRYEYGGANLNSFYDYRSRHCTMEQMLPCFKQFTAARKSSIDAGSRVAFSVEYKRRDDYDYSDHGLAVALEGQTSLVSQLTYGRYLDIGSANDIVQGRTKLDLTASYEDVSDDPMRQDRAVATLALSQGTTAGLTLSFSLVWANRPEFRGDVDEELSAKVGLNYKLAGQ